jgi:hypothetical protein
MKSLPLLLFPLLLVACEEEAAPSKPREMVSTYECSLEVAKKPTSYEGKAQMDGDATPELEAEVEKAAWADACAKVPEAQRTDCKKDSPKFTWSAGGGTFTVNGKTSVSKNITVTERTDGFAGKATSDKSADDAHAAALAQACKAAGASGDCVASGAYEERNDMRSRESVLR